MQLVINHNDGGVLHCSTIRPTGDKLSADDVYFIDPEEIEEITYELPDAEHIRKALQVLVDNGIEEDEAPIVLQAIGYTLLDEELMEAVEITVDPNAENPLSDDNTFMPDKSMITLANALIRQLRNLRASDEEVINAIKDECKWPVGFAIDFLENFDREIEES